ncbi:tripartite tricarboxylate transporter TctB family protein [Fusobacterium perfoetens]|uniref:tripartite tricarboxylate transporter TctB family protein n=1 Tax=Fusobacterium perfoetens TaxID=852 RepID=UPI001F289410|nr:tripartite tricarboxylate transporter TctB family protein [Fusobacterium perfoetens]MCF2625046.1 tripartite tricarboxylate transporter TctB family protein [Fusobacterium perfoetens]
MKYKIKVNIVGGAIFIILSMILWYLIPSQIPINSDGIITSRSFPRLIVLLMFFSSLFIFVSDIIKLISKRPVSEVEVNLKEEGRAAVVCVLLVAYAFLLNKIGFMIASIVYCYSMLIFFKCKNWKYYIIVTIICMAVTYIFKNILLVQLP